MTRDPDARFEQDIAAYVNGQLDAADRFALASYLSDHPDRAADVMADLRLTEGLKLALGPLDTPCPAGLTAAADRLRHSRVPGRQLLRRWLPLAAAVVVAMLGWAGLRPASGPQISSTPGDVAGLLEAALDAQEALTVSLAMTDRLGPLSRDGAGLSEGLGIDLPPLPAGWVIRAAQVVASPERPGVAMIIDTPDLGEITLFTVERTIDGPDNPPDTATADGRALAFFERDRAAYVLVDDLRPAASRAPSPVADLRRSAEALAHRFN